MRSAELYIKYQGRKYTVSELAGICGIKPATLRSRLLCGWDIEKAMTTPPSHAVKIARWAYKGQMLTAAELAKIHGNIGEDAMRSRLRRGMTPEQAVKEPKSMGKAIVRNTETKRKPKKPTWKPRQSREDVHKCKRCRYSEKLGSETCCMYMVLHVPPERRGCEPGKNCTKYKGKTKQSEKTKLGEWAKGVV